MGAYGSQMKEVKEVTKDPRDPDWIITHARASGLELPETDRLWKRFQVLGADSSGILRASPDQQEITQVIGDDVFVKNIIRNLKSTNGMTFLTFVNLMKFSQSATLDDKIRAVFHLLNKGSPINEDMLCKVMKHVYAATEEHGDSIKILAKNCVRDMTIGTDDRESVTEEAFVNYMQRFPKSTLEEILKVNVIPISVRRDIAREQEAQRNKELHDKRVADREKLVAEMEAAKAARGDGQDVSPVDIPQVSPIPRPVPSGKPLTDDLLRQVARAISPKADWNLLANRLGFLQRETQALEVNYSESREDMLHAMLKAWRNRGELSSSARTLHRALAYCRMEEAAEVLSTS